MKIDLEQTKMEKKKIERKFSLGVFACVFNKEFSKILLLKRNEEKRKRNNADWGNIGGRIELGETAIEACTREAREEIGVNFNPDELKLIDIIEHPNICEEWHIVHFVYAIAISENEKITINYESEEYRWFPIHDLPDRMIDTPREIIKFRNIAKAKH